MQHLGRVVAQWRAGGYFDRVMAAGPELDRVKQFLRACAGEQAVAAASPWQRPHYPCFPGLRHRPWHDASEFAAAALLERSFTTIRDEARGLGTDAHLDYSSAARPWRSWKQPWTMLRPDAAAGTWTVYLLHHMGVAVEDVMGRCPATFAAVNALPRACPQYPWGDFLFSAMNAGAHLRPHCSIDNLRVRLHLGIDIPQRCSMRVADETRTWVEGKCIAFEDSFEHEVWNRSPKRRTVLIADLWHPDLSDIEVRALTAAFRKSQVRRAFLRERIEMTDAPERYVRRVEAALHDQDGEEVIREFWPR